MIGAKMAEEERKRGRRYGEESVKLFVGQVPKKMSEPQLLAFLKNFAVVDEVNIITHKTTGASRGCCFVICPSREEADKVIDAFHNKKILPGASSPLQVNYADGELDRLEHKLFVGMIPKNASESEVFELFSKYGTITDLLILRDPQQRSKGCAFLKYETKEQAIAAIDSLSRKHKMEGSMAPLVVKWADTEKERQARRAQKSLSQASNVPNADSQPPSLDEALLMGYMVPYNGYGYQTSGAYGLMQYHLPPVQTQYALHNLIPPVNKRNAVSGVQPNMSPGIGPRNYQITVAAYMRSASQAIPGVQYLMPYPVGIISKRPLRGSPGSVPHLSADSVVASSNIKKSLGGHLEGPPGANLFIYDIPQEFGDQELADAFQPYGRIVSATVYVDKETGVSKCFGFVSYDSREAAETAINMMNGRLLGGKKLRVEHKREGKQNKS